MPYTITTLPEFQGNRAEGAGFKQNVTRIAVATLDEAREGAYQTVYNAERPDMDDDAAAKPLTALYNAARSLPESGGTVGPLPDGTVIEVQPVGWPALRERAGLNPVYDGAELTILDVFNAR